MAKKKPAFPSSPESNWVSGAAGDGLKVIANSGTRRSVSCVLPSGGRLRDYSVQLIKRVVDKVDMLRSVAVSVGGAQKLDVSGEKMAPSGNDLGLDS